MAIGDVLATTRKPEYLCFFPFFIASSLIQCWRLPCASCRSSHPSCPLLQYCAVDRHSYGVKDVRGRLYPRETRSEKQITSCTSGRMATRTAQLSSDRMVRMFCSNLQDRKADFPACPHSPWHSLPLNLPCSPGCGACPRFTARHHAPFLAPIFRTRRLIATPLLLLVKARQELCGQDTQRHTLRRHSDTASADLGVPH